MDKKEEKEIEYLNSHINRLWTSMIVLVGGLSGVLLSFSGNESVYKIIIKTIFLLLGAIFIVVTIKGLINSDKRINNKIK